MKEALASRGREAYQSFYNEAKKAVKMVRQKPLELVAGVIAIGLPIVEAGCQKTPEPTITPTPHVAPATKPACEWSILPITRPECTPVEKSTEISAPISIPTKIPEPTPKPTQIPEPTPISTPTPEPIPTPEPAPSPTPEVEKIIFLKPDDSFAWTTPVTLSSGPEKRMINVVLEGGDTRNVKIEHRLSNNPQRVFENGSEISFKQGITTVKTTITVYSGASETCFNKVTFSEYSREQGSTGLPINIVPFDEKLCIEKSIEVFFSHHESEGNEDNDEITFFNTSRIKQEVIFWVPDDKCSKYAQRQFLEDNDIMSELRVEIPAYGPTHGIVKRTMRTIRAYGEPASSTCYIQFTPVLKN